MGFPELDSDESVILQAHNIKVKSVVFEAVLTNKRLVLVDDKKGLIPTQAIPISTINTVDGGENAIRDPILTFSIFTQEGTARQMILTFPRSASGERKRERDDWLKTLHAQIASAEKSPDLPDTTRAGQPPSQKAGVVFPSSSASSGSSFQKKKIDVSRPRRSIIESAPVMPRPIETTSLPVGSFCSRCGNRVPPESVFCNRCGTAVVSPAEVPADPEIAPLPVISTVPAAAPSAVPQVQVPTPPVFGLTGEHKERTLEEVIHSIEPLIEDSKPRSSEPAPLVPRHYPAPHTVVETPVIVPAGDATQADSPAQPAAAEPVPDATAPPASPPPSPPAVPVVPPAKSRLVTFAALAIVILVVIGGIVVFANPFGSTPQTTVITPAVTPVPTATVATPVPSPSPAVTPVVTSAEPSKPEVLIPKNGVWIRITYAGKFSGTVGTPSNQYTVGERDTGDQFFSIPTINGPAVASIQKLDGSSGSLAIEVYKNGELMKRTTTAAPKGIIDLQVDLKPAPTPSPTPTQTVNPTVTNTAQNSSVSTP